MLTIPEVVSSMQQHVMCVTGSLFGTKWEEFLSLIDLINLITSTDFNQLS